MTSKNLSLVLKKQLDLCFENRDVPEPGNGEVLIAVNSVGICGSDVHYWCDGHIGDFFVEYPLILGHESSGTVVKLGANVKHLKVGDRVAVEPGVPCHECRYCKHGRYNICQNIVFLATPPVNGNLCRYHVHSAAFCYRLPDNMSFEEGALIEPLSVAVHACRRGNVKVGQKVLITGAGPVGLMCMLAAKASGAAEICFTDIIDHRLEVAKKLGATYTLNVSKMDPHVAATKVCEIIKDEPDITMECSGVENSIQLGLYATRPGGVVVLVGMSPNFVNLPLVNASIKEIDIHGVFRYANCYPIAIGLVASGAINVKPLVTHRFSLEKGIEAFETVLNKRDNPIKVIIKCEEEPNGPSA